MLKAKLRERGGEEVQLRFEALIMQKEKVQVQVQVQVKEEEMKEATPVVVAQDEALNGEQAGAPLMEQARPAERQQLWLHIQVA